jgi:methylglutaconyl-CoA hydratase
MSDLLQTQINGAVAHLILNRPEKRNALSANLIAEMLAAMLAFNADPNIRVIVLRSAGKAFCAGADLAYLTDLRTNTLEENEADSQNLRALFDAIYVSPKYIISQVEGPALAGGCGLATLADFCVATPEATFGYTEVKIGFIPALVMVYLREKVSGSVMSDILLSGRIFSATEAKEMQLINRVVDAEKIAAVIQEHALSICETTSPQALAKVKEMMRAIPNMQRAEALDYAAKQNAEARGSEDCRKGIDAFLNKQPLKWS